MLRVKNTINDTKGGRDGSNRRRQLERNKLIFRINEIIIIGLEEKLITEMKTMMVKKIQ